MATARDQNKNHSLSSRQFMTGLSKILVLNSKQGAKCDGKQPPPFTNDAVEALRLCHEEFLHFVAGELGHRNQNSADTKDAAAIITVEHVMECLKSIGFEELGKDALADLGRRGW